MKIVTNACEHINFLQAILRDFDVQCIEDADEKFIEEAEVFVGMGWKDIERLLPRMKKLKMIQTLSAGVNHIKFEKLPPNIIVCSSAGANAAAVAELAVTHILVALKKYVYRHEKMKRGEFPQMLESRLLHGKTVGIVGLGNVGKNVARMLKCFSPRIIGVTRSGKSKVDIDFVGDMSYLDELLSQSDIVVLALPLTKETEGLIDKKRLEKMKKDAILVNVARGKLIVEKDLYEHVKKNPEFTVALDVWWHYSDKFKQDYPFEKLPNVLMTPHCGGVYENFWEDLIRFAAENIKLFSKGEPRNVVRREDYI